MSDDSNLLNASWPIKIGGQEFLAYPFNDRDYQEIDNYIQAKVIEVAKKSLEGISDLQARSELLQAAIKASAASGWGTLEGSRIINTYEGTMRLGWQMIKSKNRISFVDFLKLGANNTFDAMSEVDTAFGKLNIFNVKESEEESKGDSSENPKS